MANEVQLLFSNHEACEGAYAQSIEYLGTHPGLRSTIDQHTLAYSVLDELIPQPVTRLFSGHDFPVTESFSELRNSLELALQGFYNHAFSSNRSTLELGMLGLYFSDGAVDKSEISNWIRSCERTPGIKQLLPKLAKFKPFTEAEGRFGLLTRVGDIFDNLGAYVHTRGVKHSSTGQRRSNVNRFLENPFRRWVKALEHVCATVTFAFLVKHPIGIIGLPMDEKFGLDPPLGLALNTGESERLRAVLTPAEVSFVEELARQDPRVQSIVQWVHSQPDLAESDFQRQADTWDEIFAAGKTGLDLGGK
jgi:hypothetical protein